MQMVVTMIQIHLKFPETTRNYFKKWNWSTDCTDCICKRRDYYSNYYFKRKDYTTTPKISIESATGQGAVLTAVIKNNELDSVTVVRGGKGYNQDTTFLTVSETGQGAVFESGIQRWTVNEVERMIDSKRVVADDSFPSVSYSRKYELNTVTFMDLEHEIYRKEIRRYQWCQNL